MKIIEMSNPYDTLTLKISDYFLLIVPGVILAYVLYSNFIYGDWFFVAYVIIIVSIIFYHDYKKKSSDTGVSTSLFSLFMGIILSFILLPFSKFNIPLLMFFLIIVIFVLIYLALRFLVRRHNSSFTYYEIRDLENPLDLLKRIKKILKKLSIKHSIEKNGHYPITFVIYIEKQDKIEKMKIGYEAKFKGKKDISDILWISYSKESNQRRELISNILDIN